jgi:simple sugar transport system permease protein
MKTNLKQRPMRIRDFLSRIHLESQTIILMGIFVILMLFFGLSESEFLTSRSITSMAFQLPEIGILSMGMMITVLIGGINLSINATANLSSVIAGFFLLKFVPADAGAGQIGFYIGVSYLIAILVGVISGAFNGFLVGYLNVPPILATLANMNLFTGIAVGLTKGRTVTGFPDAVGVVGGNTILGIPISFLVFVFITIITFIVLNKTTFGYKVRMLGTNALASKFSGINNKKIIMQVFIYSGIMASVSGILIMSRTMSAAYQYGSSTYVLLTILIGVLAGIVAGFGNVLNVFITVLVLQIISTGFHMVLAGVSGSSFFKDFIWGLLLIIIFIINYFSRLRKGIE